MHPTRARETTPAEHTEAKNSACGVADTDQFAGNGVWVYHDATPLIFNDTDHPSCLRSPSHYAAKQATEDKALTASLTAQRSSQVVSIKDVTHILCQKVAA